MVQRCNALVYYFLLLSVTRAMRKQQTLSSFKKRHRTGDGECLFNEPRLSQGTYIERRSCPWHLWNTDFFFFEGEVGHGRSDTDSPIHAK